MKANPLKNRSARERVQRRKEELEQQRYAQEQQNKENKDIMWVVAIGFIAISLLLMISAEIKGMTMSDAIVYFVMAGIMCAYSGISLIACKRYQIQDIKLQLYLTMLNGIFMIVHTLIGLFR